jgi:glutaredoxin
MAKNLLERKNIEYEYLTMEAGSDILVEIKERTQQLTVPLIFEVTETGTETFIGGFTDLNNKLTRI